MFSAAAFFAMTKRKRQDTVDILNLGNEPAHASMDSGVVIAFTCHRRGGAKVTGMVELKGAQGLIIDTRVNPPPECESYQRTISS